MSGKPGVLFLVNSLGVGGAERHVVTLLNQLDADRFRLHLAHLRPPATLAVELDMQRIERLLALDVSRGIDLKAAASLARLIDVQRIEALVCTNCFSMLYGTLAQALSKRRPPLATVFHSSELLSRGERLGMLLYRRLFARCDLLIYVCESQRRIWRERGIRARRDAVIYNGIDTERYRASPAPEPGNDVRARWGVPAEAVLIGQCGALRPEKAVPDLIEALAQLGRAGRDAHLLLIGDGPQRTLVERLAAARSLADRVHVTGLQSDVRPCIAACDILTLVSRIETFSLAALESMAMGRPLVMSNVGGAAELVTPGVNGLLFAPGDVRQLAQHLLTLSDDGNLRLRLGQAGAQRVRERFSLPAMVAGFTAALDSLIVRGAGADAPCPPKPDPLTARW